MQAAVLGHRMFPASSGSFLLTMLLPVVGCPRPAGTWSPHVAGAKQTPTKILGCTVQRFPHAVDQDTGAFAYGHTMIDWLHVPKDAIADFIHLANHFRRHDVMLEAAVPQVRPPADPATSWRCNNAWDGSVPGVMARVGVVCALRFRAAGLLLCTAGRGSRPHMWPCLELCGPHGMCSQPLGARAHIYGVAKGSTDAAWCWCCRSCSFWRGRMAGSPRQASITLTSSESPAPLRLVMHVRFEGLCPPYVSSNLALQQSLQALLGNVSGDC